MQPSRGTPSFPGQTVSSLSFLRSWLTIPLPRYVGTELCYPQLGLFSPRDRDLLSAERSPRLHLEVASLMGSLLHQVAALCWTERGTDIPGSDQRLPRWLPARVHPLPTTRASTVPFQWNFLSFFFFLIKFISRGNSHSP